MREGPEGTIAYWRRGGDALCRRCAGERGTEGARPVVLHAQEASGAPRHCGECARAVGNRLSARGLDAMVQRICAYDEQTMDEAEIDGLVEAYAETIQGRTTVDLLLKEYDWSVCLSEPDRQRALVWDLGECAMAGESSRTVERVAEHYRIVAAPGGLRRELEGRGYEAETLGSHHGNIRKAIWEMGYEQEFGDAGREEGGGARDVHMELRARWGEGGHERGRRLAIKAWRATERASASCAARVLARGEKIWVEKTQHTEDGRLSVRAGWEIEAEEDEVNEIEMTSEVPRRITEAIERACAGEGAEIESLRTMHEVWGASLRAEVGWGPHR